MMQIFVNGEPLRISPGMSMAELVEQLQLGGERIAVEVNEELVPRSGFAKHQLRNQDRIEIIHAVGGG